MELEFTETQKYIIKLCNDDICKILRGDRLSYELDDEIIFEVHHEFDCDDEDPFHKRMDDLDK